MNDDLNDRFLVIIVKCQQLRYENGFDYEQKCVKQIEKFSKEIIDKQLIEKCKDKDFAQQLCIMNSLCMDYILKNN
jgi:hypothetical protein